MRAFMATNLVGVFAYDADEKMVAHKLFPKDPEKVAENLSAVKQGKTLPEEQEVLKELMKQGFKEVMVERPLETKGINIMCIQVKENPATEKLQSEYRKYALDFRWATSQAEINEILTKVNVLLTRTQLKKVKKDRILMQAVSALDEIDKDLNVFTDHLREWYGLYFPESIKHFDSNESFVRFVADEPRKELLKDNRLADAARNSSGMPFDDDDLREIQEFALKVSGLQEERKTLARYVEGVAKGTIPNVSAVAGAILGSKLLVLAGGLEKLSKMPSSTIQLLGAEKALFRHLKGQGKAPKYGVLFGHGYIQNAPKHLKGKVARLIAAKVSIAARVDHFSHEDRGEDFRKQLDEQIARLK
jgi:nucleolar protein 56